MEPLKNSLNLSAITRLGHSIQAVLPTFEKQAFIDLAMRDIEELSLKERVKHITTALHKFLPSPFSAAEPLFLTISDKWQYGNHDDAYEKFAAWPLIDYIAVYGSNDPEIAIPLLAEVTGLFTAEFAVRTFLIKHYEQTSYHLLLWAKSDNEHIRRLASEGTRPRLPWAIQLEKFIEQPELNIPLLTMLRYDESLYVRRSVANHLNDIAKDHPDLVIATCKTWLSQSKNENTDKQKNIHWLIKHATRTLVKDGHPDVFSLLGYSDNLQVSISNISLSSENIKIGSELTFDFIITSTAQVAQKMVVDFSIHFVKSNGTCSPKVFKLKTLDIQPDEKVLITKKHSFKLINTRKYYPGHHKIELLVNGSVYQTSSINLLK